MDRKVFFNKKTGKYGLRDFGRCVIPARYDEISINSMTDLAVLKLGDKYGMADIWGKVIVPVEYDEVRAFFNGYNIIAVRKSDKWQFIDRRCNPITLPDIEDYNEYLECEVITILRKNKWQFIKFDGNPLIPDYFDDVTKGTFRLFAVKQGNKYGVLNCKGQFLAEIIYDEAIVESCDYYLLKQKDLWGAFDYLGNLIIPFEFIEIKETQYKRKLNKFIQLKQKKLKEIIEFHDNEEDSTGNNTFICKRKNGEEMKFHYTRQKFDTFEVNEKSGVIDNFGKIIIPPIYEIICVNNEDDLMIAFKDNKWGYIDFENNIVIPFKFKHAEHFWDSEYASVAIEDDKWGIINRKGEIVLPFEYQDIIISFENGMARVNRNGVTIEIDINGNKI